MVWPKRSSWNCNLCTEGSPAASGQTTLAPEVSQSKSDYLLGDDKHVQGCKIQSEKTKTHQASRKSGITALLKIKSNLIFNALSLKRLNIIIQTNLFIATISLYLATLLSTGLRMMLSQEKGIKRNNSWNLPFSVASAVSRTTKLWVRTSV